jgi:hypothetical protein
MKTTHSDSLDQFAPALVAARSEVKEILATREGDTGRYKFIYADLGDILVDLAPVLSKHGLVLLQTNVPLESPVITSRQVELSQGKVVTRPCHCFGTLRTTLLHCSGQWMAGEISIVCDWGDRLELGGTIQYLRRVAIKSALSVDERDYRESTGEEGEVATTYAAPMQVPSSGLAPPGRRDRDTPAHQFAREQSTARFNIAPQQSAELQPQPEPSRAIVRIPQGAPNCPYPRWPKGGFYGWCKENNLINWFNWLGSAEDVNFPERLTDWTNDQIVWACKQYENERLGANPHYASNGNGR